MRKILLLILISLLSASLFGCISDKFGAQVIKEVQASENTQVSEVAQMNENTQGTEETRANEVTQQITKNDEEAVASLVEDFGKKLQKVSLLSPEDILNESMNENYGGLVSPALLEKWKKDPGNSPGRLVSSPWPDRIEIQIIKKSSDEMYEVKGEIIEITSVELEKGGVAAKRPITLNVKKMENRWLIDSVVLGAYSQARSIVYANTQYDFSFSLPKSWEGYTIVNDKWEGLAFDEQGQKTVETGPEICIRHPEWTSQNPRQDIPIMIFTLKQWKSLQKDEFHIGAAPVGPSELGRNSGYVFALPARYNFAFPTGYEEVENILKNNPLH